MNITNNRGSIFLRNTTHFFQGKSLGPWNTGEVANFSYADFPLATGFDILLGRIEVTVPHVTGTDIRVVREYYRHLPPVFTL